jgi:hypothetical protein
MKKMFLRKHLFSRTETEKTGSSQVMFGPFLIFIFLQIHFLLQNTYLCYSTSYRKVKKLFFKISIIL